MMKNRLAAFAVALGIAGWSAAVLAAPVAYWRHEQGAAGTPIPAGPDTVLDSTGNGNHMETFDPTFTSATYTSTVSPLPLRSGLANTRALDFGPGGDDAGNNDDNFTTAGKPISGMLFNALTVEAAFRMDAVTGYQAILGKDGKPLGNSPGEPDSPVPPFKVLIRGDDFPDAIPNQLFIEWIDGDGTLGSDIHFLNSGETIVPNTWYHIAMTLNATTAQLYVAKQNTPYQLKDTISGDFAGTAGNVLVSEPLGWTIGRGMFNNNVADWSNAIIDEVRISDTVLTPGQFLFRAVPEPASVALSLLATFALMCWPRRR